jgi:hypothetical protein
MKACVERLKTELDSDDFLKLGEKCKAASKTSIKDCYECAYELIKDNTPEKKAAAGGANGCCSTF